MRCLVHRAVITSIPTISNSTTCSLNCDDGCASSETVFTAGHRADCRELGQAGEAGKRQPGGRVSSWGLSGGALGPACASRIFLGALGEEESFAALWEGAQVITAQLLKETWSSQDHRDSQATRRRSCRLRLKEALRK